MTAGVSGDWQIPVGPWLAALVLSCAIHGVAVWEGLTFFWPVPVELRVMPVELVRPSPEPHRPDRPGPATPTRRSAPETSREVPPTPPQARPPESQPQTPARAEAEQHTWGVPAGSPAASPPVETPAAAQAIVPVAPAATSSSEVGPSGPVAGPAPARLEVAPGGTVAAAGTIAPAPPRITRSARPRGGYQVRPAYPAVARRAGVQGTTVLRVHVSADGSIDDVQVSRSAGHPALDEAAAAAVGRWRFDPARSGSEPVAVWVLIPVEFRLEGAN